MPVVPILAPHHHAVRANQRVVGAFRKVKAVIITRTLPYQGTSPKQQEPLRVPTRINGQHYSRENPPDYATIKLYKEYWELVWWTATHPIKREPKSMADLADKFGIHRVRLSEWKYMPEFARDVEATAQEAIGGESYSTAIRAWLLKIAANPSVGDIKYLNEWKGIFSSTKRYSGKLAITPGVPKVVPPPPPKIVTSTPSNLSRKSFA